MSREAPSPPCRAGRCDVCASSLGDPFEDLARSGDSPEATRQLSLFNKLDTWTRASATCALCGIVSSLVQQLRARHGLSIGDGARLINRGFRPCLLEVHVLAEADTMPDYEFVVLDDPGSSNPVEPFRRGGKIAPVAGAPACIGQARSWGDRCRSTHLGCRPPQAPPLPTRVVTTAPPFRLIQVDSATRREPYAALSHCWGASQPLRTLRANIPAHLAGIPLGALPRTFRDAISVARDLGYPYIWIDSLCIVQDDTADWEREASLMAAVYGNADLVIAASSSGGSGDGFLGPRRDHRQGTISVRNPAATLCYQPLVDHHRRNPFSGAGEGPLHTRAWAFQERALARRFLSFGAHELAWTCNAAAWCECGLVDPRHAVAVGRRDPGGLDALLARAGSGPFSMVWLEDVVTPYSRRQLTKGPDKLVALSAVSEAFQRVAPGGARFVAGLWSDGLVMGLAWASQPSPGAGDAAAPSWSWASVGGVVHWNAIKTVVWNPAAEVVAYDCVPSTANRFGPVRDASVALSGLFVRVRLRVASSRHRSPLTHTLHAPSGLDAPLSADVALEASMLAMPDGTSARGVLRKAQPSGGGVGIGPGDYTAWALRLGTTESVDFGSFSMHCLVLGRLSSKPERYQRVGLASFSVAVEGESALLRDWVSRQVVIL